MTSRASLVLLYAEDRSGLGHVNLMLAITRDILQKHRHVMAVLVTESPIVGTFTLPARCDHIKLPTRRPLVAPGALALDKSAATDQEYVRRGRLKKRFRSLRRRLLVDTVLELIPDLVLVDHEPVGYDAELRDALHALRQASPSTGIVFLMRDITDDPATTREAWHKEGAYDALDQLYDGIAVYGSPRIHDVVSTYGLSPLSAAKLHYCGYVVRDRSFTDSCLVRQQYDVPIGAPLVTVTVGSGSDGYEVLSATASALKRMSGRYPDLHAVLVTGPYMAPEERALIMQQVGARCRVVEQADIPDLLATADAAITMGGYNTVFEALAAACPLIVIPRRPRQDRKREQSMRAEALASHGLVSHIPPGDVDPSQLAQALSRALETDRLEYSKRIHQLIPSFDGAAQLTGYLSRWLDSDGDRQS